MGFSSSKNMEKPAEVVADAPPPPPKCEALAFVALGRCRYSDLQGKVCTAERGSVLVDPLQSDLAELQEMGIVAEFEAKYVPALQCALAANPVVVRAILGL